MPPFVPHCLFFATILAHLSLLECKVQVGSIQLGATSSEEKGWHFAGKFGYGIGVGSYRVRARLRHNAATQEYPKLNFHIFLDEDWDKVESLRSCSEKSTFARKTEPLHLASDGEWGEWTDGIVSQNVRPHIWYFAMSSCQQALSDAALAIDYEVHMTQVDGSEFSFEMRGMMGWSCFALICLTIFGLRYWSRCRAFVGSVGGLHQVIWVLTAAITLQYFAQVFHIWHLRKYQSDGVGIKIVDTLSEVLSMMSQIVVTTLLIALAMGYTLLPSRIGQLSIVKSIAGFSLVLHAALVSIAKLQGESACKYHENEGAVGWVLMSVRLMLFAWFVFAVQASQDQGGPRLHNFLNRFRLAGSLYFLAYPLLFVVVQLFAPYLQHPIMQIGLLAMQALSNAWLGELFLSRGTYFKVSALSSPLLPTGTNCASMFDKLS